ncbi:MAG: hypothetical protein ABEH40_06215 [Haloferacaceae archaeon]
MAGDDARDPTDGGLSSERIDTLLTDRRRRYALCCLYARPNPVSLPDVADQVTEWEHGRPAEELPDERLHVYMSLYHDHVPVLVAADLIRYSQSADAVALADRATEPRVEGPIRAELADLRDR